MKLGELLDVRRVIVPLKARTVREATRQLAKVMTATGVVADDARLTEMLKTEWPEDVVTVAGRAFLPHFRTAAVTKLSMALGVSPEPICLANDKSRCARVVVLIVAPVDEAAEYLRAMSALARALSDETVLDGLHKAQAAQDVMTLPGLAAPIPADVTVADIMTTDVSSVTPKTTLAEAAQLMLSRNLNAVPVTGPQGEVVGLLSEAHLLRHLLPATGRKRTGPRTVKDVMDRAVMCLSEEQTIAEVAQLMLTKDIEGFPVTREGALVGFLTRGDIVRKLLRT